MSDDENRVCISCGGRAPSTNTEYTLIGRKHAWRCKKTSGGDGLVALEWYCPPCWKAQGGTTAQAGDVAVKGSALGAGLRAAGDAVGRWLATATTPKRPSDPSTSTKRATRAKKK